MKKNKLKLFAGIVFLFVISIYPLDKTLCKVTRVIDGDTVEVSINGIIEKVRLIGIDTPELHHPNKPVEYFAEEAYKYTKDQLEGKNVYLENDSQSANRDKYNRLLRYIWIDDELFNAKIIKEGYAHAYTLFLFDRLEEFRKYEAEARDNDRGLWGNNNRPIIKENKDENLKNTIVCITRTGKKYHRCSCSYLRKSSIPIKLIDAVNRGYSPCSRCNPPTLN